MKEDRSKLVKVFKGTLWEAELLKSMLGDNGIEAVTKDSMVVNLTLPDTAVEVSVLVNEDKEQDATQVVHQFIKNKKE